MSSHSRPNSDSSNTAPEALIAHFIEGTATIFVGAGLSADALPVWKELMEAFTSSLEPLPTDSTYPDIAQFFQDKHGRGALINTLSKKLRVPFGKVLNIHRSLLSLPIRHIFTTNFDKLLESAIAQKGEYFKAIVLDEDVPWFRFEDMKSIHLVKVHGDLDNGASIVFTSTDYEGFFRNHPAMRRLTEFVLQTRYVLFLGYSFSDPDLRTMLGQVFAEAGRFGLRSYIAMFDPPEAVVRSLDRRNLEVIPLITGGRPKTQVITEWIDRLGTAIRSQQANRISPFSHNLHSRAFIIPPPTYAVFVGRQAIETRLVRSIATSVITVVHGVAGTGKTSVVTKVSADLVDGNHLPTCGRLFWIVAEGHRDSTAWLNHIFNHIARLAGYPLVAQIPLEQLHRKAAEIDKILHEIQTLIIIDDFHNVQGLVVRDWLTQLSAKISEVRVVLIARPQNADLLPPCNALRVDGLEVTEASELIEEQAKALGIESYLSRESQAALSDLISAVNGNPQALEQAIGLIARTNQNVGQIVAAIRGGTGADIAGILGVLCAGSWDALTDTARTVLKAVPVFSETCSIRPDALQMVSGISDVAVFEAALVELVALRLLDLEPIEMRYTLHPTTRQYARLRLGETKDLEQHYRSELAAFTLQLLQDAIVREKPEPLYWNALVTSGMATIDREWPNVRQVVEWVLREQPGEIARFLIVLVHYLDSRFLNDDRLRYVNETLRSLEVRGDSPHLVALLRIDALGWTHIEDGELRKAAEELNVGESIARTLAPEEGLELMALAQAWRGRLKVEEADEPGLAPEVIKECFEQAGICVRAALEMQARSPWIRARVHMAAGDVAFKEHDYREALSSYQLSVSEEEEYGGEGQQYQLAPRLGLAHLGIYGDSGDMKSDDKRIHLLQARRYFQTLAAHKEITVGKLYGEYGLALADFTDKDLHRAKERVVQIRANLDRRTSSSLLKKMVDKLFCDLQTATDR